MNQCNRTLKYNIVYEFRYLKKKKFNIFKSADYNMKRHLRCFRITLYSTANSESTMFQYQLWLWFL
jgi:hypothetical protein